MAKAEDGHAEVWDSESCPNGHYLIRQNYPRIWGEIVVALRVVAGWNIAGQIWIPGRLTLGA